MRIVLVRWFITSRKHVRIPLTVGFLLVCIGTFVVAASGRGPFYTGGDSISGGGGSRLVATKVKPLRRHSVDDDEIHDSELVKAVVQSLSEWNQRRARRKRQAHRVKRDEEVVCYGDLGCFRDEGPFDYLDMLPSSPDEISTRFLLYTRANRQLPETFSYFNYTSMFTSKFNASAPTKVIIHGFGSTCNRIWASEMRLTLLSVVECNVICVDWENGATIPNYVRAAVNTRLVGKQVALLISWLNAELGSRTQDFHLIGFSLGAHVAGFAGHELKNLSRITGLDPAGPLYESYDKKVRLDSSDALFVDVIHSNGDSLLMGGLGSWEPMGHVDFYPNGGRVQKGCSNLFLGAVRDFLWSGSDADGRSLCNHRRAYKFFTESISPRCPFPAFSCDSYEKFIGGSCFTWDTSKCGNMGYFADRLPNPKQGLLYLVTREDEPFCANQYKIALESSPSTAPISTYGGIEAVLIGHDFINETFLITKTLKESMVPGAMLQRMLVAHPAIIEPIQIQLKYTAYQGWLYSGISRWSMDSLVLTNAYGKSVSFCARLLLPSGIAVTIRLTPGVCVNRFPSTATTGVGRPIFPTSPKDTPHPTTATDPVQGSTTSGDNITISGISPSPTGMFDPVSVSIIKPPGTGNGHYPVGNNHNSSREEMTPAGPPYHVMSPGSGGQWTESWHPIAPFTPVETFPHVEEEDNSTEVPRPTTNPSQDDGETTPPITKLRICLMGEGNESIPVTNTGTGQNMSCVQSEEDASTSGSSGPVMSNNALGQINSYHQELLREDELFHHHTNAVEVESSHGNPTSTDLAIPMPPESFWSAVHNNTLAHANVAQREQDTTSTGDPPMPPHLSYILQQLESQGLGPGPGPKLRFGDRLSHVTHESGNFLRGLIDGQSMTSAKFPTTTMTRRLIPSSRALKMRPVSLTTGHNSPSIVTPGGTSSMNHNLGHQRRQAKILDLNFSPSSPEGHSHFSPRHQDLRWLQPPPPRNPYMGGANSNPLVYVTKNPQTKGNGFYLIPHSHYPEINSNNGGGRIKMRRLLQSQQQLVPPPPPPLSITTEIPPSQIKTYFEDNHFRQAFSVPRWAPAGQQTY